MLDGRIQSSQADEFIYHELLVQPVLLAHRVPERAMVIGGGEGATVREILRHGASPVPDVTSTAKWSTSARSTCPRCTRRVRRPAHPLLHEDARAYLEKTSDRFDLIVVDLVEPLEGTGVLLFTKEFSC